MNIFDRSISRFLDAPFRLYNYKSLFGIFRSCKNPVDAFYRYFSCKGEYPHEISLRTPTGPVSVKMHSFHDMLTVNEVFCRDDYKLDKSAQVVVDIGANIGVTALFFLTRNKDLRCYLFEPVPVNLERLKDNVEDFADRIEINPVALGNREGLQQFSTEPSGRYGGFSDISFQAEEFDSTTLLCRRSEAEIDRILDKEGFIDFLKVDAEGAEVEILESLRPDQLQRIKVIAIELGGLSAVKYVYPLKEGLEPLNKLLTFAKDFMETANANQKLAASAASSVER